MQLERMLVEGYRSIGDPVELHIDGHVTVVLGANDHGKTNLLEALVHLNPDEHFDGERDLNWDRAHREDDLPAVSFRLQLDDHEQRSLSEIQRLALEERTLIEELEAHSIATSELEDRWVEAKSNVDSVAAGTRAGTAIAEPATGVDDAGDGPEDTDSDKTQAVAAREAAEQRLADVDGELTAARRNQLALKGRLVQIRAMLESLPEETALDQLIQHRERQLSDAEQKANEASTESEEAATKLEAGKTQHAEGSAELAAFTTASTRATRALSTARQSVDRAREQLSEARQQADALNDMGGVSFRTPETKQNNHRVCFLSVVACEGNLPSSSQTTMA